MILLNMLLQIVVILYLVYAVTTQGWTYLNIIIAVLWLISFVSASVQRYVLAKKRKETAKKGK
ncbi:MAG: hypothetical protein HXP25_00030 [Veillonella sp.]|jgi:multisubunit Na+/H+ antiporter MnhF subunit|nr:hypothetical protein [Veillonella sp.]